MTSPAMPSINVGQNTCTSNRWQFWPPAANPRGLAVIIPSRGRPHQLGRMLVASLAMSSNQTHFFIGIDTDDQAIEVYRKYEAFLRDYGRVHFSYQARLGLSAWSNYLAWTTNGAFDLLVSLGDDHMPLMPDWDYRIHRAHRQGGFASVVFPCAKSDLGLPPTAFSVPYVVAHKLGWFTQPEMHHYWIDNVWADLTYLAGNGRYLLPPAITHLHHTDGLADLDPTYQISEALQLADHAAYQHWLTAHCAADAATIERLLV